MPRISQFYGIAIYQYYRDHPPPHFHAIYGDFEAVVAIATADIAEGSCRGELGCSSKSGRRCTVTNCWQTGIARGKASR